MKRGGEPGNNVLHIDDDEVTAELVRGCVDWVGETADADNMKRREAVLHQEVLRAIAEGRCNDPAACADEALRTIDRWLASI